jgi:predicted PurR-regulated permease PerM
MSDDAPFRRGFLLALVIGISVAFFAIIRDFVMTMFVAAIFSGVAHPLYRQLLAAFGGRKALASAMTLLTLVLVVGGPLVAVVTIVTNEALGMTENVTPWVIIASVDNLMHPRLVGQDTQMSDLLILLSTLGGIGAFGAIGFIVGPIIAALFVTCWEIFGTAYRQDLDVEPQPQIHLVEPRTQ